MTAAELKNLFRTTLQAQRSIAQEYTVLDAIVDFIAQALTSGIPDWTNALTFQTDGTGAGSFCIYPDTNDKIRFWKTKVDDNIGNPPPTNPLTTEDANWIEVSPADGSAIKEWAAGVYGEGLVIVYHNHTTEGRGLYILLEPTRPYESTDIETEITAGDWVSLLIAPAPTKLQKSKNQTAHGFAVGNVLRIDNTGAFAKISNPITQKWIGVVTELTDANNFVYVYAGYITGLSGLTAGSVYYAQSDGTLSTTVTKMPVLVADSTTTGHLLSTGNGAKYFTELEDTFSLAGNALKALRVNAAETEVEPYTPLAPVTNSYATVAALLAAQGAQVIHNRYMVFDASADPAVTTGWALYQYLGTTNGDLTDYFLVEKQETANPYPDLTGDTAVDGGGFDFSFTNLQLFEINADAFDITTNLLNLTGDLQVNGAMYVDDNVRLFNNTADMEGGDGILFMGECTTEPAAAPTAGVFEYVKDGRKKLVDPDGNITIF